MKKKVIAVILVLTAAVALVVFRPSLAWLSDVFTKTQAISIADLNFEFEGGLHAAYIDESSSEFVAPGENLIYVNNNPGALKAFNLSSIPSNLRVRVDYSFWNGSILQTVAFGEETDDFYVDFAVDTDWEYEPTSKCWLYKPTDVAGKPYDIPAFVEPVTEPEETTAEPLTGDELVLINALGYSGDLAAGNDYETKNVFITLTVEVKQADFVDWTTVISDVYNP